MLNKNTTRGLLLTTCVTATMVSAGCRSMPGMKMFARRSEPSAEALAGTGPTTTYPAPPSASATPEAIASVAGGTATPSLGNKPGAVTAQVAGYNITPGYAAPASNIAPSANLSAAQANGVYNGASYAPPSSTATKPSGYTFGSNSASPSTNSNTGGMAAASSSAPSSYAPASYAPSSYPSAKSSYSLPGSIATTKPLTAPSTSYAPPPSLENKSITASIADSAPVQASLSSGSGFTLPPDIAPSNAPAIKPASSAIKSASASITPTSSGVSASTTGSSPSSYSLPASASPSFSTAKATSTPASSSSSYMPGSTGKATGYPSGSESPTTSGSFYR